MVTMSKTKASYRVTNWRAYDRALVERGDITLWVDEAVADTWWQACGSSRRGRPETFSDVAILTALTLRTFYRLPLRSVVGLLRSLFRMMDLPLSSPVHTTLSRRAAKLTIDLSAPSRAISGPKHLVIDASGLKVYGEGEWHVRTHGKSKRRTWRKLHLAINAQSHELEACELTESNVGDCEVLPALLDEVDGEIATAAADGAYDTLAVYDAIDARGARAVIPPRSGAALSPHAQRTWGAVRRNQTVAACWHLGKAEWKRGVGYHRRSLAETGIGRFKALTGGGLASRRFDNQQVEARLRCRLLNRLTALGMPKSVRR